MRRAASVSSSTPRAGDDWHQFDTLSRARPTHPGRTSARRSSWVDASLGARRAARPRLAAVVRMDRRVRARAVYVWAVRARVGGVRWFEFVGRIEPLSDWYRACRSWSCAGGPPPPAMCVLFAPSGLTSPGGLGPAALVARAALPEPVTAVSCLALASGGLVGRRRDARGRGQVEPYVRVGALAAASAWLGDASRKASRSSSARRFSARRGP